MNRLLSGVNLPLPRKDMREDSDAVALLEARAR